MSVVTARYCGTGGITDADTARAISEMLDITGRLPGTQLDAIQISLVPVILGRGIPWLAGTHGPVRLCDPEVIEDRGVTHLRYVVRK